MANLQRPYISVTNERGIKIGTGGNQGWFSKEPWSNVSGQGCGIISSLDVYFYLSGVKAISKQSYEEAVEDFIRNTLFAKLFMHEFFHGRVVVGITPWQICSYLNRILRGKYKVSYNGRFGHEKMLEKMEWMIDRDIPVIWSLYRMGKKIMLYTYKSVTQEYVPAITTNSHYVNAIGVIHETGGKHSRMVKISSWGKIYYIDYDEYLEYVGSSIISSVCSNIFVIKKC